MLKIKDLKASIDNKEILKGVDLEVKPGELHVLMGPNGSGKSTLAQVIAGHPSYTIDNGQLTFDKKELKKLTPDKRARMGIFLGFQHPVEVPGVSVFNMLRRASQNITGPVIGAEVGLPSSPVFKRKRPAAASNAASDTLPSPSRRAESSSENVAHGQTSPRLTIGAFREELLEYASSLKLGGEILGRSLNEGFSGGEKKRNEILQMMALAPRLVILDEIDSGLDVDGVKVVASAIKRFALVNRRSSLVIITHYARILKYLKPDFVHVMVDGRIVKSGNSRLAGEIEKSGYEKFMEGNKKSKIKDQNDNAKFKILI